MQEKLVEINGRRVSVEAGVADEIAALRDALLPFALQHLRRPTGEHGRQAFRQLGLENAVYYRAAIAKLYPEYLPMFDETFAG